jgi:hypothetical protein
MGTRYSHIYEKSEYKTKDIKLYFVTDPYKYKSRGLTYEKCENLQNTRMEKLILEKPFEYRGKLYQIQPTIPDPLIIKL